MSSPAQLPQPATGYSKRSLIEKLGIKPSQRGVILNAPTTYLTRLGALPSGVKITDVVGYNLDFIQFFALERAMLEEHFAQLKAALAPAGMLWISWPKQAAKLATDLDENKVRTIGLAHGLVDVKVIAVDPVWSGLKFVYRRSDRSKSTP